jgi:metal-responsive CopG/Arc/MetJ family transcriptional regulator
MKSHVSITLEKGLIDELKRISRQERRSLSNLLELAALEYLKNRRVTTSIQTSSGRFEGTFSREGSYGER